MHGHTCWLDWAPSSFLQTRGHRTAGAGGADLHGKLPVSRGHVCCDVSVLLLSTALCSAPELFQVPSDSEVTEAVDIWSLGCTLFEAAFCECALHTSPHTSHLQHLPSHITPTAPPLTHHTYSTLPLISLHNSTLHLTPTLDLTSTPPSPGPTCSHSHPPTSQFRPPSSTALYPAGTRCFDGSATAAVSGRLPLPRNQ